MTTGTVLMALASLVLGQKCWAQPAQKDVAHSDIPLVRQDISGKVRETENEEPIDEEILNQFKKYTIDNTKVLMELGKQELRLLSYLSGRKRGGDLLFGTIAEEIPNMLPTAPGSPPLSDSPTEEDVTLPIPPHGIGAAAIAQNIVDPVGQVPVVSQQPALPVPSIPVPPQNIGIQVPVVSQQSALPVPSIPALAQNTGTQVPVISQQSALPVPSIPAPPQNTGIQVPVVSEQSALPVPSIPALAQNPVGQLSVVSQQSALPVPSIPEPPQNTGIQVPVVSQQSALPVPSIPEPPQNTGIQVPVVSQQSALPMPSIPASPQYTDIQVPVVSQQSALPVSSIPAPAQNTGSQLPLYQTGAISAPFSQGLQQQSAPKPTYTSPNISPPSYTAPAAPSRPLNPLAGDAFHHSFDFVTLPALKPVYI